VRKRYTRKYRHWSSRFKWSAQNEARLIEFEREWQGGRRILKRRKQDCAATSNFGDGPPSLTRKTSEVHILQRPPKPGQKPF
jgi:hypothetical protein